MSDFFGKIGSLSQMLAIQRHKNGEKKHNRLWGNSRWDISLRVCFFPFVFVYVCLFFMPGIHNKKVDLEGGEYVYMYIYMCVCSVDTFGINSEESASHSKHPATLCDVSCFHVGMPSTLWSLRLQTAWTKLMTSWTKHSLNLMGLMSLPGSSNGFLLAQVLETIFTAEGKFHVPLASGSPDICIEIGAKAPSQDANIEIWGRLHRHEMDKQDSLGDSFQTTRTPNRNTIYTRAPAISAWKVWWWNIFRSHI